MSAASQSSTLGHPGDGAVGTAPVGAEHPERAEGVERGARLAGAGGLEHLPAGRHDRLAHRRQRLGRARRPDVGGNPAHAVPARRPARPGRRRRHPAGPPRPGPRWRRRSGARAAAPRCRRRWRRRRSDRPTDRPSTGARVRPVLGHGLAGGGRQPLTGRRAHHQAVGGRADDVAEHGAGLDRSQLLGVADEHQPGVGPDRLDQPGHERQATPSRSRRR